ncbi:MarR family transcriptional regulator [Nocardia sp. IFM 10818]
MPTDTTATPATTARTTSEDALWSALEANPNSTTNELAQASAVAKSSARKILAGWAADGLVTRDNTGTDSTFRWKIADTEAAESTVETDSVAAESAAVEEAAPAAADTETTADPEADPAADLEPDAVSADAAPEQTDEQPVDEAAQAGDAAAPTPGLCPTCGRKMPKPQGSQPGALRGLVEDWLREHPDQEATPGQISKELNRSSGAIVNALFALVGKGVAVETCERPHKFKLHPDKKAEQEAEQTADQEN